MPEHAAAYVTADMLVGLNHEIRTSMNGVAGMLTLLLDSDLTATQRRLASDAQLCAEKLMGLFENLLDFSMIDAGRFELAHDPFELKPILHAACAAAQDKGAALRFHFPAALTLRGDAARLRQIISGLLDAAVSATRQGQIGVDAETACEDRHCRLQVTVTAPGRQLGALLQPSCKIDASTLRAHGGTALELALCRQLARLMNAQIEAFSLAEDVSCIRFSVALERAPAAIAGIRVLVLEQRGTEAGTLAHLLRAQGMRADAFNTVEAALAALGTAAAEHDPYRIAILGDRVQGMDCEILGAAIKAEPAYREMRLVAQSEWPRRDGRPDLVQAGFSAAIATPVLPEQALTVLNTLCTAIANGRECGFVAPDVAAPPRLGAPCFTGRRILVADDNPVNRQVAQRMTEKLGCIVEVAADGLQAVALHAKQAYDLILMDCQMPHLDGYQATQRIRALDGAAGRTPIVAVTACATQGERERCLSRGMNDFIAKPLRPHLLEEVLGRWLAGAAPEQSVHADGCGDELEVVQQMFGADFAELAMLYQKDSPPRIATLHLAHAAGDYQQMAKVAHALSGSSVSIGAIGLSALCKELEQCAKAGAADDFEARLGAIEAEYERISARLRALIQSKTEAA